MANNMKRYIATMLTVLLIARGASAQEKFFYVSLDVNKPLSNTSWVGDVSSRGLKAGYRAFINERFSAGLDITSTTFDQYQPTITVQTENGAVTSDYFKYIYSYSVTASGQYYFKAGDSERFFPYVGLGLGANNNEYVLYYNIYTDSERKWGFLARPEAGILVKLSKRGSIGAIAALHYDYSTNKSPMFEYSNFSSVGFNIGLMLMDW
jgi:outer membrane protein W